MRRFVILLFFILLLFVSENAYTGQVIIEPYQGIWDDNGTFKIIPICPVSFNVRIINDNGVNVGGFATGFRIWTTGGTNFTPLSGDTLPVDFGGGDGWADIFDLNYYISCFSCDGIGADTIGFIGARLSGEGLPDGFNGLAYRLYTGNIQNGEVLCLDSSYFPPTGSWLWVPGGAPSWDGPHCFQAIEPPCLPPHFTNCVDSLTFEPCDTVFYDFDATDTISRCKKTIPNEVYVIIDGPGAINSSTGEWFYIPTAEDINTNMTLTVGVYDLCYERRTECIVTLNFTISQLLVDINQDCSADIADLVYLVEHMFNSGPPPPVFELADVDGSGELNIADLVYLVEYMFNDGPPPVDPWG